MKLALLLIAVLLYPYALSVSSAELQRSHSYTALASAPAGSVVEVKAPAGITAMLVGRQGDTLKYVLTVSADAPLSRTPREIALVVDGRTVAFATVRIWTDEVPAVRVWLPLVAQ